MYRRDVLKNKKYRDYKGISRYSSFPIYYHTLDDKWVGGSTLYLRNDTPYVPHKVKAGDSYDNLALYYYNNPTLYWVICSFNHIQDPFKNPPLGATLRIPTLSSIQYNI